MGKNLEFGRKKGRRNLFADLMDARTKMDTEIKIHGEREEEKNLGLINRRLRAFEGVKWLGEMFLRVRLSEAKGTKKERNATSAATCRFFLSSCQNRALIHH